MPRRRIGLSNTVRAFKYLLVGFPSSLASLVTLVLLPGLIVSLSVLVIGVPLIPEIIRMVRVLTRAERRKISRYLGVPVEAGYLPIKGPASTRLHIALTDAATRRDVVWLAFNATIGMIISVIGIWLSVGMLYAASVPLWWKLVPADQPVSPVFPVTSWLGALGTLGIAVCQAMVAVLVAPRLARWHARVGKAMLSPPKRGRKRLAVQVAELTASKAAALEAHGIELRRIERDLHDGTQNRLVAVTMHLGMVERALRKDPSIALPLVLRAHDAAVDALAGLRDVVRSIYPPILADRGLRGALSALVFRSSIQCELNVSTLRPAPAAVEATAYFIVAEALTNVAKHSGAQHADVRLGSGKDSLLITVSDDGHGGADENLGTGLAGMRRRVAAFAGRMSLTSPPGGPTVLSVELPCGS